MSISLTNFKNGFFSLQKLCRNELLQKMVGDLNKAQVDILLKHLDKSSVFQEDSLTSDECSAVPDLFKLTSSYESLNVAQKLELLVEIIENLRSCDSEDLVEIIDNRLDELINNSNLSNLRGCEHVIQAIWREVKKYYQSAVKISPKFQCFCPRKCFLFLFDDWKREAFEQIWNEKRKLKEQQRSQQ